MKAFVLIGILVASVAAQNMDLMKLKQEQRSLLKKSSLVEDLLLKEKLSGHFMDRTDDYEVPVWGRQQVTVLPLEEVVQTSLFRQFYNIPLFRQYWNQYPTIFHKYVQSVLFQQFWTIPEFQQYFRNPIFFYKYIVPQVQVIAQTMKHEGIYNYNVESTLEKEMYPYGIYNQEMVTPMMTTQDIGMESIYNTNTFATKTNYKYLLDKIYKHLNMGFYNNKIGQIEETLTDVKMTPNGHVKEQTFGKIVDPYTGEEKITIGDIKMVDEKIMPVQKSMMNIYPTSTLVEKMMMKDALKRMYMNKMFGKVMTPEYETIYGKKFMTPEYETIFGLKNKGIMTPEYETLSNIYNKGIFTPEFQTKKFMTPEYETIFGLKNKGIMTPEYETIFGLKNKGIMTPEYETIFGLKNKGIMTPEFETLMGNKQYESMYDMPTTTTYKYMSPMVQRMMGLNKMNKVEQLEKLLEILPIEKKMELLNKIQNEKMIQNIKTENIIKDTMNMTPKIMTESEKFEHIPLTYTKPVIGSSGINEFAQEKEIKY